eukprot:CCRYP_012401-RB/>CCRYP_012401-RB protein AED:0.27 eAED:0.27 QI:186/0/1/1/0/0/2/173/59
MPKLFYVQCIPPFDKFMRKIALKVKHKIMNRKSSIQLEYEKLAEQYGVSKSDLKMQVHV